MGEPFFLLADKRARLSFGGAPSESFEARQSTDVQLETNNASSKIGYGADNLYGDATGANRDPQPEYAAGLKTTESQTIDLKNCGENLTLLPTRESSRSVAPDPANGFSPPMGCSCISCLGIGAYMSFDSEGYKCRFPSCSHTFEWNFNKKCNSHERSHYGQPGKYTCLAQDCHAVTKNFGDLRRHDKAKHCTNPNKEQFPCPVLWCKYSGNNGFARKDKLKSHYRNIHEGKPGPAKAGRVIKPATLKPQVSGLECSAGKQKE